MNAKKLIVCQNYDDPMIHTVNRDDISCKNETKNSIHELSEVLNYSSDSDDDFYTKNTDMKKIRTTVTNRDDLPEVTYNRQSIGEAKPDTAVFHYDDDSDSLDLSGPEPEPESLIQRGNELLFPFLALAASEPRTPRPMHL
ncbi:hypothetical protein KIN20_024099 [Parelaphostrongylus tenuis]|uniref:Uncharacterized protein n=1 Tax=Parelaphostrongylus tenuis TaxID=148309 RepID=A0AAD5QWI1_PARTN|nr:hypothetical protein KIN20_024099 [Parelaphostrongylus tenuis]